MWSCRNSIARGLESLCGVKRQVVVNMGEDVLAASVVLSVKGKPSIVAHKFVTLDGDDPNAVAWLREFVREHGVAGCQAVLVVPGMSTFARFVALPPVSKDKELQIVRYEAEQNVPFPIAEVSWDYAVVSRQEGTPRVALFAAKDEFVRRKFDVAKAAGLKPVGVHPVTVDLANVARGLSADCTMAVMVGKKSTDMVLVEKSAMYARSIPVGSLQYDSATGDGVARFHQEVSRSVKFHVSQNGGSMPVNVVVWGQGWPSFDGVGTVANAAGRLPEQLDLMVCMRGLVDDWAGEDVVADQSAVGAAASVLAMAGKAAYSVALRPNVKRRGNQALKRLLEVSAGIAAIALVCAGIVFGVNRVGEVQSPSVAATRHEQAPDPVGNSMLEIMARATDMRATIAIENDPDGEVISVDVKGVAANALDAMAYARQLVDRRKWSSSEVELSPSPTGCSFRVVLSR